MKKAIAILLAAAALLVSVNASAQDKWVLNHVGLGVSAGLDGVGADLILPVTPFIQIRGGYATLNVPTKDPTSIDIGTMRVDMSKANGDPWDLHQDVTASVTANVDAAHLFIDLYPGKKTGLHFTVGAYYGLHPENGGPYRIGTKEPLQIDESDKGMTGIGLNREDGSTEYFTTDKQGNLFIDYNLNNALAEKFDFLPENIYPYAGIGLGRNLSRSRINLSLDLGVIYTGGITLTGYNYMYADDPDLGVSKTVIHASDFDAIKGLSDQIPEKVIDTVEEYYGKVESIPVTPVLRFNLAFRLF